MSHEYQPVEDAFRDGTISYASVDDLNKYLLSLANQPLQNDQIKHRDIIRGITINHILLQRHIDGLNKQNTKTQRLVIALTIASLIGTVAQVWYAAKADKTPEEKTPTIAAKQQAPEQQAAAPSPASPPVSDQPKKK